MFAAAAAACLDADFALEPFDLAMVEPVTMYVWMDGVVRERERRRDGLALAVGLSLSPVSLKVGDGGRVCLFLGHVTQFRGGKGVHFIRQREGE